MTTPPTTCARCRRPMVDHYAQTVPQGAARRNSRGLCSGCWTWAKRTDRLADYPRATRPAADVAEDYRILRGRGLDHDQIAARLGLRSASLHRALHRVRARTRTAT